MVHQQTTEIAKSQHTVYYYTALSEEPGWDVKANINTYTGILNYNHKLYQTCLCIRK